VSSLGSTDGPAPLQAPQTSINEWIIAELKKKEKKIKLLSRLFLIPEIDNPYKTLIAEPTFKRNHSDHGKV
jgi:hypothetical protein